MQSETTINTARPLSTVIQSTIEPSLFKRYITSSQISEDIRISYGKYDIPSFLQCSHKYIKSLRLMITLVSKGLERPGIDSLCSVAKSYRDLDIASRNLQSLDEMDEEIINQYDGASFAEKESIVRRRRVQSRIGQGIDTLKSKASVGLQYQEIHDSVIQSIRDEIAKCFDTASVIEVEYRNVTFQDKKLTFQSIIDTCDKKEVSLDGHSTNIIPMTLKLPTVTAKACRIIEEFNSLNAKIEPLNVSISYIPHELEAFNHAAKNVYPSSVLKLIRDYKSLSQSFSNLDKKIKLLHEELIEKRWEHVFDDLCAEAENLMDQLSHSHKLQNSKVKYLSSLLDYLGHVIQNGLIKDGKYFHKHDNLVAQFYRIEGSASTISVETKTIKRPEKHKSSIGENFIQSLKLRPIMVEGTPISVRKTSANINCIADMKAKDKSQIKKSSRVMIDKLMKELRIPVDEEEDKENKIPSNMDKDNNTKTPKNKTPSRNSQAGTPNPFVTPTILKKQRRRSRLPQLTPTEKLQKYVPLPVVNHIMEPSLAKLVTISPSVDGTTNYSLDSYFSTPSRKQTPRARKSRIPLPTRTESRLSIAHSRSDMSINRHGSVSSTDWPEFSPQRISSYHRPASRLEILGMSISSKHGTRSPSISSGSDTLSSLRPHTAMCNLRGSRLRSPSCESNYGQKAIKRARSSLRFSGSPYGSIQGGTSRSVSCNDF